MNSSWRTQLPIFALIASAMSNIYIAQPILPLLQEEFQVSIILASMTVSAVVLGLATASLPLSFFAEKIDLKKIILTGGCGIACTGFICSLTHNFWLFIAARALQGFFVPFISTCLATYLAQTTPIKNLKVVMGIYISATVVGGMSGRLICGWIYAPHWRYAFLTMALLTLFLSAFVYRKLPRCSPKKAETSVPLISLLNRWDLIRIYLCASVVFAIFSASFTYFPYRLTHAPFALSTQKMTSLYLFYSMGIIMGPISGQISTRIGAGRTIVIGSVILGMSLLLTLSNNLMITAAGILLLCTGFFTIHSVAVGLLNYKLSRGQGYGNALYVLFYYLGGWIGITSFGFIYQAVWLGGTDIHCPERSTYPTLNRPIRG
ncbi:MFS transporter [Desulfotalea psychrophila]|nr:MFS transporter [Desulfotalea psychrophila]